ncbi:MAG: dihydrolipoamide acetyltransferase, partial [Deltaproteobacteria bacterium]|nr:dihydrolipoamide acetyltransferase [Kofleriaceae bacterium]
PETMPVNLRLRRLEQRVQALKERAWRAKARTTQLKEAVLGGGVGAQATLVHVNRMGSSFRLHRLVYALDGTQIFARSAETNQNLYKTKSFDVLTGPISPGSHTISVLAIYKGHGYGVFKYLTKYTFTVRSSHTFTAAEGKSTRIEAVGFEKGGPTTPLEKRPAIDFKVTAGTGAKDN